MPLALLGCSAGLVQKAHSEPWRSTKSMRSSAQRQTFPEVRCAVNGVPQVFGAEAEPFFNVPASDVVMGQRGGDGLFDDGVVGGFDFQFFVGARRVDQLVDKIVEDAALEVFNKGFGDEPGGQPHLFFVQGVAHRSGFLRIDLIVVHKDGKVRQFGLNLFVEVFVQFRVAVQQFDFLRRADVKTPVVFLQVDHVVVGAEQEVGVGFDVRLVSPHGVYGESFFGDELLDQVGHLGHVVDIAHLEFVDHDKEFVVHLGVGEVVQALEYFGGGVAVADQWGHDLVKKHAFAGALGAVQNVAGQRFGFVFDNKGDPVEEVFEFFVVGTDDGVDDFIEGRTEVFHLSGTAEFCAPVVFGDVDNTGKQPRLVVALDRAVIQVDLPVVVLCEDE